MQVSEFPIPGPVEGLFGYLSGAAAVLGIGAVRKYTTIMDTAIRKKLQPWMATAIALGVPLVARQFLGVEVDGAQFVAAPTAALAMIGARELLTLAQRHGPHQ